MQMFKILSRHILPLFYTVTYATQKIKHGMQFLSPYLDFLHFSQTVTFSLKII